MTGPAPRPPDPDGDGGVVARAAAVLAEAYRTGIPCPPLRETLLPPGDVAVAYEVQRAQLREWVAAGRRPVGAKVGLTSPAVQRQLGVDQPDFGVLLADMAVPDGAEVELGSLLQPRVEAEVAFVLGRDIDLTEEEITLEAVRAAVDVALPALEIVDSRIAEWRIGFTDTVADNASSGLFVVGREGRRLEELEPREVEMSLTINGEERSAGTGAACLGDPLEALRWLAVQASRYGDPLRAGHLILSGALGPFVPFASGDRVSASISGFAPLVVEFEE